jgi:hypothetical protein
VAGFRKGWKNHSSPTPLPCGMAPGIKRPATDDLDGEQRLAKRFDLLHLGTLSQTYHLEYRQLNASSPEPQERNGKLYIPPPPSDESSLNKPPKRRLPRLDDEWMDLEDTKYKTYIHDLDAELEEAAVESDEERPIFMPDIEKHIMKLPKHVMQSMLDEKAMQNQQLVLYGAPTSLSIPEDKDSVRRAIIEARQRARDTQALRVPDVSEAFNTPPANTNGYIPPGTNDYLGDPYQGLSNGRRPPLPNCGEMDDSDAMDIG